MFFRDTENYKTRLALKELTVWLGELPHLDIWKESFLAWMLFELCEGKLGLGMRRGREECLGSWEYV